MVHSMRAGAEKIVRQCASVRAGEEVVIVTDEVTCEIAEMLRSVAAEAGAETVMLMVNPRRFDGEEPPAPVGRALDGADVVFAAVSRSITHTLAVKNCLAKGGRAIMMTAFRPSMLATGGIEADFAALRPTALAVASLFERADLVRVRAPGGTDVVFSARGRRGNAHTGIVGPGEMSTVPNVEASVSPVEGTGEGTIVLDGSIPYYGIGLLSESVTLRVESGRVTAITGGKQADAIRRLLEETGDPDSYNLAQLAIGLNPWCKLQGIMLEDEGVYGTAHFGIGTSLLLGGGTKAASHFDGVFWRPTIELDGIPLMVDGQLVPGLVPMPPCLI